jgi:ABC-type transport system involved in multi-copper enzyme maturation permease subunit
MSGARIGAVVRKELRDYRRNRFIVVTMAISALIFAGLPMADVFSFAPSTPSTALNKLVGLSLLYMLIIPVVVPATIAAYAIVGERDQGTLEPLLTTPVTREELILGKALAALVPALGVAYAVFGFFLLMVHFFAHPEIASAIFGSPKLYAQLIFTPLLSGWSIWVGLTVSARVHDVRVAQQLTMFGSLPPLALTSLMTFGLVSPTFTLALVLALALLVVDSAGWRLVATIVDRERLITGSKPARNRARPESSPLFASDEERYREGAEVTATLMLSRSSRRGVIAPRQDWEIEIDGRSAGTVARGQTVELPIEAGQHTLRVRSHRLRSRIRSFEAAEGETVSFSCRGQMFWFMYFVSLLQPEIAIILKRD